MRTSGDSPIYVNFLELDEPERPGRIGLTFAPGKHDSWAGWHRDLDADLDRLRDQYSCHVLVSLLEPHEYEMLGIPGLFDGCAERGIDVVHFPIPDLCAPPPDAMERFGVLVSGILDSVSAGKTVVIHCRGGIGRTGTVAACCLVALGHGPAEAIERVRAVRPGSVEMPEQEGWVAEFARHPAGPHGQARAGRVTGAGGS